jgi:serine protease Do
VFRSFTKCTRLSVVSAAALAVAAGLAGGLAWADSTARSGPTTNPEAVRVAAELSEAFRGAAIAVKPSVVSIRAEHLGATAPAVLQGSEQGPFGNESFRQFFGPDLPKGMFKEWHFQSGPRAQESEGSGLIVRKDGYIVTNNHVVNGASKLTVRLEDGRDLPGKVVGTDPDTDLAVVKIEAGNLPVGSFGDSTKMEPGDWVVAVGSPFGLQETVTAGIVSAIGRSDVGVGTYENFIQTDTPINPGNSGGPLVNLEGKVIGINTAIRTASGGSNGIGFAIPARTASGVADTLIAKGHVERGWLGVSIQPLTKDLAATFNDPEGKGALVSAVIPDSPAAKQGIQSGDVITKVNEEAITSPRELSNAIGEMAPGKKVTMDLLRDGKARTLTIDLGTRPSPAELASDKPSESGISESMGLSVQPLTTDLAKQLGVPEVEHGLAVSEVAPESAAAKAGLQEGDVILQAGKRNISSMDELRSAWSAAKKDQGLLLKIRRGDSSLFTVLKHQS